MLNSFCNDCYLSNTIPPTVRPQRLGLQDGPQCNAELPAWIESSVDTRWMPFHEEIPSGSSSYFEDLRAAFINSPSSSPSPPPSIFSSVNSSAASGSTIPSSIDSSFTSGSGLGLQNTMIDPVWEIERLNSATLFPELDPWLSGSPVVYNSVGNSSTKQQEDNELQAHMHVHSAIKQKDPERQETKGLKYGQISDGVTYALFNCIPTWNVSGVKDVTGPGSKLSRINKRHWEACKSDIHLLYVEQLKTLCQTMQEIEAKFAFTASWRQWKRQIRVWGFDRDRSSRFVNDEATKRARSDGKEVASLRAGLKNNTERQVNTSKENPKTQAVSLGGACTYDEISYEMASTKEALEVLEPGLLLKIGNRSPDEAETVIQSVEDTGCLIATYPNDEVIIDGINFSNTSKKPYIHTREPILNLHKDSEVQADEEVIDDATDESSFHHISTKSSSQGLSEIPDYSQTRTEMFLEGMIKECQGSFMLSPDSSLTSHGGTNPPSRSAETPSSLSTPLNFNRKSICARERGDEEDEEENRRSNRDSKRPRVGTSSGLFPSLDQGRRLACHLHISDPQTFCKNSRTMKKYDTCSGPGWLDVHHLKQHLGHSASSVHKKIRCPLCHKAFKSDSSVLNHQREMRNCKEVSLGIDSDEISDTCWAQIENTTRQTFERLAQDTREKIDVWVESNLFAYNCPKKPLYSRKDELRKWYMIWDILCPEIAIPPHPFYDSEPFLPMSRKEILKRAFKENVEARIGTGDLPENFTDYLGLLVEDCLQEAIYRVSSDSMASVEILSASRSPLGNRSTMLSPPSQRASQSVNSVAQTSSQTSLPGPFSLEPATENNGEPGYRGLSQDEFPVESQSPNLGSFVNILQEPEISEASRSEYIDPRTLQTSRNFDEIQNSDPIVSAAATSAEAEVSWSPAPIEDFMQVEDFQWHLILDMTSLYDWK